MIKMATKLVLLFLALMLCVGVCRTEEFLDEQGALNVLRELLERETLAGIGRQPDFYRSVRGNRPIFGNPSQLKLPRFVRREASMD